MKNVFLFFLIILTKVTVSQNDSLIKQFETGKNKITKNGMIVLSSWAGANLIVGAVGYGISKDYYEKEFHLMNASWGAINLAIALPGLIGKTKPANSLYDLQRKQTNTEKLFLANAMLDVVYVSGGFYLKEKAKNQISTGTEPNYKQQRLDAFGNSIILQGAGLFVFDVFMTVLTNQHRKKRLDPFLQKTSFSFSGNYAKFTYSF